MMKKKVKKIPKYNAGTINASVLDKAMEGRFKTPIPQGKPQPMASLAAHGAPGGATSGLSKDSSVAAGGSGFGGWGGQIGAAATAGGKMLMDAFGVEDNSQAGVTLNSSMQGAEIGGAMVPGWGHLIGGVTGGLIGAFKKGGVDEFGNITYGGIFGRSKSSLQREANVKKNSIAAVTHTQNLQADYYNNPNVTLQPTTAAEGGIMRQPVDALVSKGELIYNPMTKKLSKVPGSKGKPNKADDVYARLYEGDVVISNSPTMLMANGKTPAQNLEGLVDKYATGGTVKAREAIIKKVVNWQEANKTKPQEYAKFKDGWNGEIKTWDDYLKYQYSLSKDNKIDSLDNFWGYDSKNKKYTSRWDKIIKHIGENKELREKAIKDLSGLSYVGTGKDAWDNIVKAAYDTNPADVHRYFKSVGDVLQTNEDVLKPIASIRNVISVPKGISQKTVKSSIDGVDIVNSYVPQQESEKLVAPPLKKVYGLTDTYDKDVDDAYRSLRNRKRSPKLRQLGENILDFAPLAAAWFGDYDYHTESSQITPPRFVPVNADPRPLLRAADESSSIGNYNLANMGVGTGAYLAHSAQLASDRAKRYADAYKWQQETNNKLIAQNAGIYNDWRKQRDAYATQAIADTRANEGAAQQMRDSAIRDAYEFVAGRRNDRMRLAMMEPLAKYAFDDDTYKKIYSRAIV